jgi:polysaccharide chain length determinant protein (PEP-CTERM system associated)
MLGHRDLAVEDYMDILRRRAWLLVIPAILAMAAAVAITYVTPARFVSQTLVLVEGQKVPDDYVKPVVSEDLNSRLASMREQILSRTRLQPIIDRFGLYSKDNASMEERVDQMRKAILITPIHSDLNRVGGLPGFFISFTADHPRIAQQVCGEITSMFLSENLKAREQSAQGTTDFLTGQLDDAKRNLDEQDGKLAEFQKKYIGQLPGQEQSNLNMLTTLNTQLEAATQSVSRAQQDETYMQAMLAAQSKESASVSAGGVPAQSTEKELQEKQQTLADLKTRYTPDHPDVVKLQKEVDGLRAKLDAAPVQAILSEERKPESPQLQQMRLQLRLLQQGLRDKKEDQARIQREIITYQSRIQSSPTVMEEYKKLTRDYQTALQFYNDLLAKKNHSEMATDLERRQQGEQFRVMDPPNLPEKPAFPDKFKFGTAGLGAGLMLGLSVVGLLEYRDRSIRNERDLLVFTQLPTLATIPVIRVTPSSKRAAWQFWKRGDKPTPSDAVVVRG